MSSAEHGRGGPRETPDQYGAFPRLSPEQLQVLSTHGERRRTAENEVLYREGEPFREFLAILSGTVEIVHGHGGPEERTVAVHGPGRFLGELGLLEGQAAFDTAVMRQPGEILAVPVDRQRALVGRDPVLGDLILRAYLGRRHLLIGLGAGFRILGSCYSPDTLRLREFAARNRLPHRWVDLEKDKEAEELLRRFAIRPEETPVVLWKGDQVMRNPSNAELARVIGLPAPSPEARRYDVMVVGAGPAGLAAAVYGASDGLTTAVVDAVATGGQAGTSSRIENYLGFPSGISGGELIERAVLQARKFDARLIVPAKVTGLTPQNDEYVVTFADGSRACASAVVLASGVWYRRLEVPGIDRLEGISVYYAATVHEASLCRADPVAVVGGGNSAGQAALFLANHASRVQLLVRGDDLNADMSRYLVDQVERHPKIEVLLHTEVRRVFGSERLEALLVEDNTSGRRRELHAAALFVFIGARPRTEWLRDVLALDEKGFVLTGADAQTFADPARWAALGRGPLPLETTLPGVFAAGDVRSGSVKRVAAATGEGAMSIHLVHEHREQTGYLARVVGPEGRRPVTGSR
ncbi:FAD-dependent oxidoreductase [Streptomyces olivaceus]|uniref:FAD-dependent oxidoreductase n=1 Tax=Streptomyces olivaceus TaxID=47716 RepID=UPI001CCD045B|nr:cyclic nucleotide-binding domain-containing thioredoxin-disulfide reductase [Streptomyces olivaceus]MBZ6139502.1 FAD-dependent oxidoreductase [Streptomyces olivaceus]MBZ6167086.1 FAD-dependent oxidoreductase [Streptomyces olivaceus]